MRIAIVGPPGAGKTYLSERYNMPVVHTDDFKRLHWSEQSRKIMHIMRNTDDVVIEGVTAARAMAKYLKVFKNEKPVDAVVWLVNSREELSGYRLVMGKQVNLVMQEIREKLESLGVIIKEIRYGQTEGK